MYLPFLCFNESLSLLVLEGDQSSLAYISPGLCLQLWRATVPPQGRRLRWPASCLGKKYPFNFWNAVSMPSEKLYSWVQNQNELFVKQCSNHLRPPGGLFMSVCCQMRVAK